MRTVEMARDQRGVTLMFVLMIMSLIAMITTGVMLFIAGELSAGVRQLQAVRVFNVAEGGVHYAIAKLNASGASTYSGESVSFSSGSTSLGTAVVTVGCVDGAALPCTGANAQYRRIVSIGSLHVGGPSRTVVAVVEGSANPTGGYGICGGADGVTIRPNITVNGDVASNSTHRDRSVEILGASGSMARVNGNVRGAGGILCSQGCATQVSGTTTPNAPNVVCATGTLPNPFPAPGSDDLTVPAGTNFLLNGSAGKGYLWRNVTVPDAPSFGQGCPGGFTDLQIQAGGAGTTTTVTFNRLDMGNCSRLIIVGSGDVVLNISDTVSNRALYAKRWARFGVLANGTDPVPAGKLTVYARSDKKETVFFDRPDIAAGHFVVPNGPFEWDNVSGETVAPRFYGSIQAKSVDIDGPITYETRLPSSGSATYANFNRMRSWKDQ